MNFKAVGLVAVVGFAFAAPAFAHHSFAMFDPSKTVTLTGVVKEFEWTNPHVWIRLSVPDAATGKTLEYALEMGSVRRSMIDGFTADALKPGDAVTATMHPLKDGSRGGMYLSVEIAGGKRYGRTGPAVGLPTPPAR